MVMTLCLCVDIYVIYFPQFVEVKGPGDRLSHKQIIWLSRLANWSYDIEVCWVTANRNL